MRSGYIEGMDVKDETLALAFGARLRELRVAAGLTQAELGERTDPPMQSQAIARYESGDRAPTFSVLYRLASALRVAPAELLPEVPALDPSGVITRVGGDGGVGLYVRFPGSGSDMLDTPRGRVLKFRVGWERALVRTEDRGEVRVYEIAPAEVADEQIAVGTFFVRGAFRIEKKHNSTRAAMAAWGALK